jgi:membrane protease YdiL (CAAX protease family)
MGIFTLVFCLVLGSFFYSGTGRAQGKAFFLDEPERERSDFLVPTVSLLLPGFGQWKEDQHGYASIYSGGALGGAFYSSYFAQKVDEKYLGDTEGLLPSRDDPHNKDPDILRARLGSQTYFTFGCLSAYHSFRSAVPTAKGDRYAFLTQEESPAELALSPFNVTYLLRPTTILPLLLGTGMLVSALQAPPKELADAQLQKSAYSPRDTLFAAPLAYNAGMGEEALFRGWLMPLLRANTGGDTTANALTALIFGLGHLSANNKAPLFQTLAGYYLGYVTQRNQWRIGESIFIHAWWDLLIVSASYAFSPLDKQKASPIIWLPPLQLSF